MDLHLSQFRINLCEFFCRHNFDSIAYLDSMIVIHLYFSSILSAARDNADDENDEYIPSHIIEIKDQPINASNESNVSNLKNRGESSLDFSLEARKEEWLECLRKTIASLLYDGDVEEVIEKHSLMLIMNTFNTYRNHPAIVVTVARLLSLPFVVESVSNDQQSQIRKVSCYN